MARTLQLASTNEAGLILKRKILPFFFFFLELLLLFLCLKNRKKGVKSPGPATQRWFGFPCQSVKQALQSVYASICSLGKRRTQN